MTRRRRRSSKGGGGFALALMLIVGIPLTLAGYLGSSSKPAAPVPSPSSPTSYVSLPASTSSSSGTLTYHGGYSSDAVAPSPADPPAHADPKPGAGETRYVSSHRVPLRESPEVKSKILDRLGPGQAVEVIVPGDAWVQVRHKLTLREGWVQAKRLRDEPPAADAEKKPEPAKISPALSPAAIAKLLIEASIASYPGPCACPYQSARNGSSCGRRAAYVRPGGYAPLCYAKDITPAMVAEYRASH